MEFKDRIKQLRIENNKTAAELAALLGKGESAVRMWELGRSKPDADTLIKLAGLFECTTDFLLGLCDARNREHIKQINTRNKRKSQLLEEYESRSTLDNISEADVLFGMMDISRCSVLLKSIGACTSPNEDLREIFLKYYENHSKLFTPMLKDSSLKIQNAEVYNYLRLYVQQEIGVLCDLLSNKRKEEIW